MFKQLKTTLKMTLSVSLLMQLGGAMAWSQTRVVSIQSSSVKNTKASTKAVSSRNSSRLSLPTRPTSTARSSKAKYAYYKRAENLSQTASLSTKAAPEEQLVTGSFAFAHSESMIDRKDGSKSASRSYIANINTKLSDEWNFTTRITYSQELRDVENPQGDFSDLRLRFSKKAHELADWVKGGHAFSIKLPTSKNSREYQKLQASVGASYSFGLTPVVLAKGFDVSLALSASRNFHQYDTDAGGNILNQYSMSESLSGAYSYKSWTFSTELVLNHGWNYEGSVSQAFEHTQEIGYSITPRWGVSVGHTNSGGWLKPNGQDSNLSLIDENDSFIYASTSVSF